MTTTSQRARVFPDPATSRPAHDWQWMRIVVWLAIVGGCTAFWAAVVAVLLAL